VTEADCFYRCRKTSLGGKLYFNLGVGLSNYWNLWESDGTNTNGLSDSVTFTWDASGTKTVFVTARNNVTELIQQINVERNVASIEVYLPAILNR
jgi:hypothetical protein